MSDEDYKKILSHYGHEKQIIKCCEELCELSAILLKYATANKSDRNGLKTAVISEFADVLNLFKQLRMILNIDKSDANGSVLAMEQRRKVVRTLKRIQESNKE